MYLNFDEYKKLGGALNETAFNDYEFRAESIIDYYTFNRLSGESTYSDKVKRCVFELIKISEKQEQTLATGANQGGGSTFSPAAIASQSNDGVSISFNVMSASQAYQALKNEIPNLIHQYLDGVRNSLGRKLLYRGVYPGE